MVERAESLAAHYPIEVARDRDGYLGTVTEMPTVFGCGPTREAALATARDHLKWAIAYLIESGRTPSRKISSAVK